jgi:CBS domain-containing protein
MEQKVISIATTALVTVSSRESVARAVGQMKQHRVGCLLVVDEDRLTGIFTERDLLGLISDGRDLSGVRVADVMTSAPEAVEANDSLNFALHKMSVGGFRHIPITHEGRAVGLVSAKDVVRFLAAEVPSGS